MIKNLFNRKEEIPEVEEKLQEKFVQCSSLDLARKAATDLIVKIEGGGLINEFKNNGKVVGYKVIPKGRTYTDGTPIVSVHIFKTNLKKTNK